MKRLVLDIDDTITFSEPDVDYADLQPRADVVAKLHDYRSMGFEIVLFTSRNMRTYENNIGKIAANTLPVIVEWLTRHNVPFDEIWVGKPWCGNDGFYVDDKAVRPDEFTNLSYNEIRTLLKKQKGYGNGV